MTLFKLGLFGLHLATMVFGSLGLTALFFGSAALHGLIPRYTINDPIFQIAALAIAITSGWLSWGILDCRPYSVIAASRR